jgi:hypothetical protein
VARVGCLYSPRCREGEFSASELPIFSKFSETKLPIDYSLWIMCGEAIAAILKVYVAIRLRRRGKWLSYGS